LLVEGQPGEAENLARVLQAAEMNLTRLPRLNPTTLAGLAVTMPLFWPMCEPMLCQTAP